MGALGYLLFANVPFLVPIGDYCGPRLVSLMPVVLFSLLYVTFCKIEIKEMKPSVAFHPPAHPYLAVIDDGGAYL